MKTHTISFISDGSIFKTQIVNHNEKVEIPEEPTLTGYAFIGWYSDERLSSEYDFDTLVTSDLVLYACWRPVFNITFNNNGHGDNPSSFISNNLGKLPVLNEDGFIFDGWYLNSSFVTKACDDFIVSKDTTLYAKWIKIIDQGEVYLEENMPYFISADKFYIEGENIVYFGKTTFYVCKTGTYIIVVVDGE